MIRWEELGLADNFIFQKVMLNEELCKKILSEILGKQVEKVVYTQYEKTIDIRKDSKSIRLDVYVKDSLGTVYSVEMQNLKKDDLTKRSRYYHDLIDLDLLEKGCRYKELNNSYVIFICDFDLFGEGYYKYTFQNQCREVKTLYLNDGQTTIFMNTEGYKGNISDDCRLFLKAIKSEFTEAPFSAILKTEVEHIKSSTKWRSEYMILSQWLEDELEEGRKKQREEALEEGIAEGRRRGLELGKKEGIEQGKKEGIEQGKKEGIEQGEKHAVVSIICNNLARGMSSSDIATFMQKDIKFVENIKKLGENTVPAYDVEQIIKKM